MSNRDIIDEIDALVDAQLEQEASGYDHNINQEWCPHCRREWHGLAITEQIEGMRSRATYDEGYRYAEDDSEVVCPGSTFIGPWVTKRQLERIRRGEPVRSQWPIWTLPDDPLDGSEWFNPNPGAPWVIRHDSEAERLRTRLWDEDWNVIFDSVDVEGPTSEVTARVREIVTSRGGARTNYSRDYRGMRGIGRVEMGANGLNYVAESEYFGVMLGWANPMIAAPRWEPDGSGHGYRRRYREHFAEDEPSGYTLADIRALRERGWRPNAVRPVNEWTIEREGRWTIEVVGPDPEPDTRTPQQRALDRRRPSTTPPMWANNPSRQNRRRNR